ncbi:hypothetical protein NP233_g4639 [Leucocoprinus birnbaumii]|uniref:NmrA-like domain-containing protein n=1 Tax=Leucocoprinus birnbaumii TaxID=56174 RepID=A0AAD5VWR3_9AGAR|nr:hypothetical protein NP233_g4639 [Leucocoprinus birnbaumii]
MTILLVGGTGTTGAPLARRISTRSEHTVLLTSRKGVKPEALSGPDHSSVHVVKFEWYDRSSWTHPFDYVAEEKLSAIDRIYLVGPFAWDVRIMNDFIDLAREKGVNRFLLLSASQAEAGTPSLGQVHGHLVKLGAEHDVQWIVVRPTWFIENLGMYQVESIRNQSAIFSVWEDGKAAFVSAEDIAELIFQRLTEWKTWNYDMIIHGPELFTNDQIADLLTSTLGRKIVHKRITKEEYIQQWSQMGLEELARGLVEGELMVAKGSEEAIFRQDSQHPASRPTSILVILLVTEGVTLFSDPPASVMTILLVCDISATGVPLAPLSQPINA